MKEPSLPKKIETVSKEVIRSSVKVYLSAFPIVGAAIDEVLFGIGDRIRASRLEDFVKTLSEKLKQAEQDKLDKSFLESEEFYDLNMKVFNAAVKTRRKEKYNALSNIFLRKVYDTEGWHTELVEVFINIIDDFSMNHITVFQCLVQNIDKFNDLRSYETLFQQFCSHIASAEIDKYLFRLYCRDIENKSLLRFSGSINEYGSSGGYIATESYEEIPGISITSMGEKFIQLLEGGSSLSGT